MSTFIRDWKQTDIKQMPKPGKEIKTHNVLTNGLLNMRTSKFS